MSFRLSNTIVHKAFLSFALLTSTAPTILAFPFSTWDTNRDGKIDINRESPPANIRRTLKEYDTDNDGFLSKKEYTHLLDSTIPNTIQPEFNLPYSNEQEIQRLDIYRSKQNRKPRPLLIFIHGGAWNLGDKASAITWNLPTVAEKSGYVLASVNFRSIQSAPWPGPAADIMSAINWLSTNGESYGYDGSHITLFGVSSGAHLAAFLSHQAQIPQKTPNPIASTILVSGAFDLNAYIEETEDLDHEKNTSPLYQFFRLPPRRSAPLLRGASPQNIPPQSNFSSLVVHGDQDALVSPQQSIRYSDFLRHHELDADLKILPGIGHTVISSDSFVSLIIGFLIRQRKSAGQIE
ncbi:MAG: alpha/beta hydrolase fold domain-containing protein [Verrucomicrobiae bacterium]|nr:alpha/beta hydrolase fold domain-containing protein [Verrucomicrobiae bacterium]